MLWAAYTTCSFGFLWSGEIRTRTDQSFDTAEDLLVVGVTVDSIQHPWLIRLHLKASKMDTFKEGADIHLPCTGDELCPVVALLSWLVHRGNLVGPLFHFQLGNPLTSARLVTKLRRALSAMCRDTDRYLDHSFRLGAATT